MIFKISDCSYAVLSAEGKREFAGKYSKLFRYGIPFKMILTPEKPNNAIGAGFRNIYFSCEDEMSEAVGEVLSSIRTGFAETSEDELTSVLCPETMFCDYAECSRWSKDIESGLLSSLCYTDSSTYSVVIVTFTPLERKEELEYLRKKRIYDARNMSKYASRDVAHEIAKAADKKVKEIGVYMRGEKKLYRIKLEIRTVSDTPEQAKEYLDFLMDRANDYGCYKLHRPTKEKQSRAKKFIRKLLHNETNSGFFNICAEKTCRKFIPFISAEVNDDSVTAFDYGVNQITKNQLLYDRKHSLLPSGIILGRSGSGKSTYVKNEILQVLEKTEDGVIVLDPDNTFGYADEIYGKLTRIDVRDNFYINPLDIVIDTFDGINLAIAEKADFIVGLIETLLPNGRECNHHEIKLIHDAVYQVLTPFANKLKEDFYACETDERACVYDFKNNPTLKDILKIIMEHDSEDVHELQELLKAQTPYLEVFCHKTMDFGNRILFNLLRTPAKLEPTYYMVICSYMSNQMMLNRLEQFGTPYGQLKHLWLYFDEAHQIFQNKRFADCVMSVYKRSRVNGTICTAITDGVTDLLSTEQGQALFSNSGFMIFLAQSSQDRKLMKEMLNVSDEMLWYVNDRPVGDGIFYNNRAMIPFFTRHKQESEDKCGKSCKN